MAFIYQLNREEFEDEASRLKDIIIERLYKDKKIDKETALDWLNNIAIIIRKPNIFKRFWDSLTTKIKEGKHSYFIVVRQLNLEVEDDEEEKNKP